MTLQQSEPFQVVMQANKAAVEHLQHQLDQKLSVVKDKQVMIESLGSRLTASIAQVSTVRQELANAKKAHNADTQVCNVYACFEAPLLQLRGPWCVCSTSCCTHAISVLEAWLWNVHAY